MRRSTWVRLGLAAGVLGFGLSGLAAQPSGTDDPANYPPDVQKQSQVFAAKCSRCHDLARPFSAKYTTEAQWRGLVARMARKPGAGISPKDQDAITHFLVYHQQAQSGSAAPPAGAGAGTPPAVSGSTPPSGAAGERVPTPPTARLESGTAPIQGAAEGGGLRVEVDAMPAQPIVTPAEGHWTTQAPGPGENLFLSVRLFDATTGEKVPYATIRARVGGDDAPAAKPLHPLFGAKGFQYGGNFAAPAGDLEVTLDVEPPPLGRVNDDGHRWASPLNLRLTLHGR
jgi:hypothetical protein